jgi:hypothetical protein
MPAARRLPAWLIEEYLAVLFGNEEMELEVRKRHAIEHHAELNFRLSGGDKCGICKTHVRHVVQVSVKRSEETTAYTCLCTRCLQGERQTADLVALTLGHATVIFHPRSTEIPLRRWNEPRSESLALLKTFAAKG